MAVLKNVTCMNPGDGKTSYANNSGLQKAVTLEALPVVDETLKEMLADGFWRSLRIVDLGCSSGPNTIFIISHIVDTIQHLNINNSDQPEIEVFFNDLPDNDFNNLFKLLPCFINQLNRKETISRCFVYGLPGSFHGTLFPNNTLHFAYSSYSLHWLSQIPQGLKNNKENIYIARTSPPEVFEAYAEQYRRDFSMFLEARGSEIVPGGRMVLTFVGRSVEDPSSEDNAAYLTLLSETLSDMVAEELIKIDDLYSFNVPIYLPYIHEVEAVIQNEGSFNLDKKQVFRVPWDAHHDDVSGGVFLEKYTRGKLVSDCVRAFMEPMLGSHFGSSIVDEVFERYAEKVAVHLITEEGAYFTILISLSRKA